MPLSVYIYYRVPAPRHAAAREAVTRLFALLRQDIGITARLLRRRDDGDTWMEVYEDLSDEAAFFAALERALDDSGLRPLLADSPRKTERFEPA